MNKLIHTILGISLIIGPSICNAWWDQGHEFVGYIAETELTPHAKKMVQELLNFPLEKPGSLDFSRATQDFVMATTWADYISKPFFENNKDPYGHSCHYLSLTVSVNELKTLPKDEALLKQRIKSASSKQEKNYISCSQTFFHILSSAKESKANKTIALRYLIHILGDMHQPLHGFSVGENKGGFAVKIPQFKVANFPVEQGHFESIDNFHFLWDSTLGVFNQFVLFDFKTKDDFAVFKKRLHGKYLADLWLDLQKDKELLGIVNKKAVQFKGPEDFEVWAFNSILMGLQHSYEGMESADGFQTQAKFVNLEEYLKVNRPLVKESLVLAGKRVAQVLNFIFRKTEGPI